MSSWTREGEFHIYKQPCIILFIIKKQWPFTDYEKSILLMNENKRIDNPQIKIAKCVGAKAQREKCVGTLQKQTLGIIFSIQNFQ